MASGIAIGALAANYCSLPCARSLQVRSLRRRMSESRTLMLTYDDGPGRELTPRVLELLSAWGAKATFFSLGRRAAEAPDLVARIVSEGHALGWHSQKHLHPWK